MGFLTELTRDVRARQADQPLDENALAELLSEAPPVRDLVGALTSDPPAIIAEVKRASPSAGTMATEVDPGVQAAAYASGGAAVISVLTEQHHFGGSLDDLAAVRAAVVLPVLRKDFLVTPAQVREARALGADSVLLITACLSDTELPEMVSASRALGMEPLVETHTDPDLERALATRARVIGVNARDLETLEVDVERAMTRLESVPTDRVAVLESGVSTFSQVERAAAAGASAILIGEALMRAKDPAALIRELRGVR